jgi:hypothetical protein
MFTISFWLRFFLKSAQQTLAALKATREADEVRAKTEARALARRNRDARRKRVKQGERGEGRNTDREDLTEGRLLGVEDKDRDERHDETLNQVLKN